MTWEEDRLDFFNDTIDYDAICSKFINTVMQVMMIVMIMMMEVVVEIIDTVDENYVDDDDYL